MHIHPTQYSVCLYSTERSSSSSYRNVTCSRHDMAEQVLT